MVDHASLAPEDSDLLRDYAEAGSEAAFAELVRRRIDLVYSVALRQTRGDVHRAEDATQAVFADLARKAPLLAKRPVLAGWLHRSAQFAATGLMRAEWRRQRREQEAQAMDNIASGGEPQPDWDRIRPVLDQALNEMEESDRDAILLRFFDDRPFAEIGRRLRLSENTARMRVERALDKLQAALARHGITSTSAALGVALGHQAGATLPAGLAASVTGAAVAGAAAGGGGWTLLFMGMNKLQVGIAAAVAVAGITGYLTQSRANEKLREDIAGQRAPVREVAALRAENQRLAATLDEVAALRRDDTAFAQLEQEVAVARKANEERIRVERKLETERIAKAEVDRLNREGNKLVEEFKLLNVQTRDLSLSADVRSQAEAAAKQKMAAIQAKQREVQSYIASVRSTLPEFMANPQQGVPRSPLNREQVQLQLPAADANAALSYYESISGLKIYRDPSIAAIVDRLEVQRPEPRPREEAMAILRTEMQRQMNIVIEKTADGTLVARKAGPP